MEIFRKLISKINFINFIPKQNVYLGRWSLKHDIESCNNYMLNYHADPGYVNAYKINKNK